MIEQYFQSHLNLLATLPFVENPQINFEKRADMVGFVRGAIEFTDGSALHYRELVDLRQPLCFLPAYSPNVNLIERMWKFVKKQCLYSNERGCFHFFWEKLRFLREPSEFITNSEFESCASSRWRRKIFPN